MEESSSILFGPVPSRRLGQSLGINNIPPKICTYGCAYCQLGHTTRSQIERQAFYEPEEIVSAVEKKIEEIHRAGETVDYLSFVPDGEPTLDINLGRSIGMLKSFGIPIAVISNTSLVWQPEVRDDLSGAQWVSLKFDSVEEGLWRRVDRPHRKLELPLILKGALEFSGSFTGKLMTETMLLAGVNDTEENLRSVAGFLSRLAPATAYLSIPTRPPAVKWAKPPDEHALNRAYHIFREKLEHVEYLTGYEGDAFASTGRPGDDILSITAVHPMRHDAVESFLARAGADWSVVQRLLDDGLLTVTKYGEHSFYLRRFKKTES